jgi:ABC-type antimicrobial peptide transport system permease subunit
MQSVRERIPEIGVLKALGYSDATMLALVLVEALLLSLAAAGLGLLAASSAFPAIMERIPSGGLEHRSSAGAGERLAAGLARPALENCRRTRGPLGGILSTPSNKWSQ